MILLAKTIFPWLKEGNMVNALIPFWDLANHDQGQVKSLRKYIWEGVKKL